MESNKEDFKKEFKKRLYKFTLKLIQYIDKLPNDNVSRRLADQLLRSGTSIIGNYIEGQFASSKRDFTNYINISLKSANESKLWISILRDSNRSKPEVVYPQLNELIEIANILASILWKLRNKK